ncbi:hypothetical protein KR084_006195 [Drosophila pseudotakahashii]|nr:hypothetical protein KR084_006195 [Drosophila pseudotakahashii]
MENTGMPIGVHSEFDYDTSPPSYQEAMGWSANGTAVARATEGVTIARTSMLMICPSCHAEIKTTTITRSPTASYVASCLFCLFSCGLGSCLIAFFLDDFKEVHHSCPNCGVSIGICR